MWWLKHRPDPRDLTRRAHTPSEKRLQAWAAHRLRMARLGLGVALTTLIATILLLLTGAQ